MAENKVFMKAPEGTSSAVIEGHEYDIPVKGANKGIIEVKQAGHVQTLQRHGFIYTDAVGEPDFDEMDKEELVKFIEEHGEDADDSMSSKKLKRLAKQAYDDSQKD